MSPSDEEITRAKRYLGAMEEQLAPGKPPEAKPPPTIESLTPNTAEVGSDPLQIEVQGDNFTDSTILLFNNSPELSAERISSTMMVFGVDPRTASGPWTVEVRVAKPGGNPSEPVTFSFTEPP
jgi:hypothetical protein